MFLLVTAAYNILFEQPPLPPGYQFFNNILRPTGMHNYSITTVTVSNRNSVNINKVLIFSSSIVVIIK